MSQACRLWQGNAQCGQSLQLRACPICRREAQHLVGLRYSQIYLCIYIHYDENSEVYAVHVHSSYRHSLQPLSHPPQTDEWSEWTR